MHTLNQKYQLMCHASLQDFGANKDENPWEFDTVRGRSFTGPPSVDQEPFFDTVSDYLSPSSSTIRPAAAPRLPSSLRGLFDDEGSSSEPDLFRPPTLQVPGLRSTPSPPSPSPSPSPSRDRTARKRALAAENNGDDLQTAKQANFAFPLRTSTPRNKSKLSASVPGSEDEDASATPITRKERPPPLGPGISATSVGSSSGTSESSDRSRGNGNYRERSASRGLPNIEIPPPLPPDSNIDFATSSPVAPSYSVENSAQITPTPRPPINRKQSQSSVTGITSRTIAIQRDRNLASPADFQFPLPLTDSPIIPAVLPLRTHSKGSSSHASVSSTSSTSPNAHQTTYSLDASASGLTPRRLPPAGSLPLPPSIHRAHSANALAATPPVSDFNSALSSVSRKPSLSRQASVAIMENVQPLPPLVPPSKPFARSGRDRSGSGSSGLSDTNISAQSLGMPGLKDVLKVCQYAVIFG